MLYNQSFFKLWYGRRDLNPHEFPHRNLNPTRLPISPRPHFFAYSDKTYKIILQDSLKRYFMQAFFKKICKIIKKVKKKEKTLLFYLTGGFLFLWRYTYVLRITRRTSSTTSSTFVSIVRTVSRITVTICNMLTR